MSTFRLKTNVPGFNEARNSPAIVADLMARGSRVAAAAAEAAGLGEDDFVVVDSSNATRARVVVIAATPAAMEAEATDRVLTRALQAAAG